MMRSLSSAVAGLRAHQTKMDVIGNNIANVNTYGFKSSRTTFADVYYQNLSAAAAPGTGSGGTNPTQIGYGAAVATIDVLNTQSGAASTDRAMDVYITGDGYIAAKDANGNTKYTRLGILGFDEAGNLVDSKGNFIMGFKMDTSKNPAVPIIPENGKVEDQNELKEINVDTNLLDRLTGISISPTGAIVGILPGETRGDFATSLPAGISNPSLANGTNYMGNINIQISAKLDSLPFFNNTADSPSITSAAAFAKGDYQYASNSAGTQITLTAPDGVTTYTASIPSSGNLLEFKNSKGQVVLTGEYNGTLPSATPQTAAATDYYITMTTTDKGGNVVTKSEPLVDGINNLGNVSLSVDKSVMDAVDYVPYNGSIGKAAVGEGEQLNIGNLALAKFRNNAGMEEVGDSYFAETSNSGKPVFVKPGLEGTGGLKASYLEMSNVDISKEFTEMITTQRGFQANTRIVTVSDEMLQELVNLKR